MAPDGGIDEVAVNGRAGGGGSIGAELDFDVCFLLAVSGLCVDSAAGAVRRLDFSAEDCKAGFAGFPDFADLSGESALRLSRELSDDAGFAGLSLLCAGCSDLRSPFADLPGFAGNCACAGVFALPASSAAWAAPALKAIATAAAAIAASLHNVSRKAFTDTDLSAAARQSQPSSTRKD